MSANLSAFAYSSQLIVLWHVDDPAVIPRQFIVRLNGERMESPILCVPLQPQVASEPAMLLVKQIKDVPASVKITIESDSGRVLASSRKAKLRPLLEKDLRDFSEAVRTRVWIGLTSHYAKALGTQTPQQQYEIVNSLAVANADNFIRRDGLAYARINHAWRGATSAGKGDVTLHSPKQVRATAGAEVLLLGNDAHAVFKLGTRLNRDEAVCLISMENGLRLPLRINVSVKQDALPPGLESAAQQQPELAAFLERSGLAK